MVIKLLGEYDYDQGAEIREDVFFVRKGVRKRLLSWVMKKNITSIHDALVYLLQGMHYTELQLQEGVAALMYQVKSFTLRREIEVYLQHSRDEMLRIDRMFNFLDCSARLREDAVIDQLLREMHAILTSTAEPHLKEVLMIGALRGMNALKLAAYQNAWELAVALQKDQVIKLLQPIIAWEMDMAKVFAMLSAQEFYRFPEVPILK